MPRKILHFDLDAFFCAVEERRDPTLRGRAFAVGGRAEGRGVVSSCSYAARRFGVRSAMPMARAVRLCPGLLVVAPRHGAYGEASEEVMERLRDLTALVEQVSIDEAFLDVSDLPDPGEAIARQLQARIGRELSLPSSLGVAANKLVAKIATDIGKASATGDLPPNAITVVPPGQEAHFLAPLPVEALWGVGPKTALRLQELGIHTIGDIVARGGTSLTDHFGLLGEELILRARGVDDRPVTTHYAAKSISQETTFPRDVNDGDALRQTLRSLADRVAQRLRQEDLVGATVKLKLRWPDFTTLTRQVTLPRPTDLDSEIYAAGLTLFEGTWKPGRRVRLLGVGVNGLCPSLRQLSLWDAGSERERRLSAAIDELRGRFGDHVIRRASAQTPREDDPPQP